MNPRSSNIFIGLQRLRRMLFAAQFTMDKGARIVYGSRVMDESAQTIRWFMIAYERRDAALKMQALEECIAWFAVLRQDIDWCVEQNLFHFAKRKSKDPKQPLSTEEAESTAKIELLKEVARIDDAMGKWWASMNNGKTIIG